MPRSGKIQIFSAGDTDRGLCRPNNEDSLLLLPENGVFAVADGMGGAAEGELASSMAVDSVREAVLLSTPSDRSEKLEAAFRNANESIAGYCLAKRYASMGTTLTCGWFDDLNLHVFHAGDSRLYRLRGDEFLCLTRDHTFAATSGIPEETLPPFMANVLTNAVGLGNGFYIDRFNTELRPGDIFLFCSDGLSRQVSSETISRILRNMCDEACAAKQLVQSANRAGGIDNVTVAVVRIATPSTHLF